MKAFEEDFSEGTCKTEDCRDHPPPHCNKNGSHCSRVAGTYIHCNKHWINVDDEQCRVVLVEDSERRVVDNSERRIVTYVPSRFRGS